jgi:hypothetical protein
MILEQVEGKSGKINYEKIISEIVNHIMTFCIGVSVLLTTSKPAQINPVEVLQRTQPLFSTKYVCFQR